MSVVIEVGVVFAPSAKKALHTTPLDAVAKTFAWPLVKLPVEQLASTAIPPGTGVPDPKVTVASGATLILCAVRLRISVIGISRFAIVITRFGIGITEATERSRAARV